MHSPFTLYHTNMTHLQPHSNFLAWRTNKIALEAGIVWYPSCIWTCVHTRVWPEIGMPRLYTYFSPFRLSPGPAWKEGVRKVWGPSRPKVPFCSLRVDNNNGNTESIAVSCPGESCRHSWAVREAGPRALCTKCSSLASVSALAALGDGLSWCWKLVWGWQYLLFGD